jgi:hypothetical protein
MNQIRSTEWAPTGQEEKIATRCRKKVAPRVVSTRLGRQAALFERFFYIYFIMNLQKYMVCHKFCKNIHLPP